MMRLVTAGTGTVSPHPARRSACHWVDWGPAPAFRLLLDCGAGACHGLAAAGLPWFELTHVAITHFHADHYGELPALLFAMKYGAERPRAAPLTIIGPAGMRAKLDALAAAFGPWVTAPGFPLEVIEIEPGGRAPGSGSREPGAGSRERVGRGAGPGPAAILLAPGATLTACRTPHTDESVAYAVATPSARLVYTGDTGPSEALGDWARPADLLLAECSLPEDRALDLHLTPAQAGALAARAHAKRLVLTHLYPPVEGTDIPGQVARHYRGPVTVARDGDRFELDG